MLGPGPGPGPDFGPAPSPPLSPQPERRRILYESNWFVLEAMGDPYDQTATLLKAACERAGATDEDLRAVFCANAIGVYSLDLT
jgi:hypothetical protein